MRILYKHPSSMWIWQRYILSSKNSESSFRKRYLSGQKPVYNSRFKKYLNKRNQCSDKQVKKNIVWLISKLHLISTIIKRQSLRRFLITFDCLFFFTCPHLSLMSFFLKPRLSLKYPSFFYHLFSFFYPLTFYITLNISICTPLL